MSKKFKDRYAIVTGGGSGIGRALAHRLASFGAHVTITDVNEERLAEVAGELEAYPVQSFSFLVDHSNEESNIKFRRDYMQNVGKTDILCLNAGVGLGGSFQDVSIEKWEWLYGINVWGAVYMLKQFLEDLQSQKSGHILITASGAGLIGIPGMSAYCSSKFAMVGLAESLRAELKGDGIVVSALCPGIINTNIIMDGHMESSVGDKSKINDMYIRFGATPERVAKDAVSGLAADQGVIVSPANTNIPWLLKRLSYSAYNGLASMFWNSRG